MPNFVNVDNKKNAKDCLWKMSSCFWNILFDHGYFCPQSDKLLIKWMYVDEIPKQYMVSKFWASITNMSYKKNTYLSKRTTTFRFFK